MTEEQFTVIGHFLRLKVYYFIVDVALVDTSLNDENLRTVIGRCTHLKTREIVRIKRGNVSR